MFSRLDDEDASSAYCSFDFMEMTQTADIAHVRRKEHFGDGKGNYMWG